MRTNADRVSTISASSASSASRTCASATGSTVVSIVTSNELETALGDQVAGNAVAVAKLGPGRILLATYLFRIRTARVKAARRWWVHRAGDIPLQDDPLLALCDRRLGHRRQEGSGVGVARSLQHLGRRAHLDQSPEVHHPHRT